MLAATQVLFPVRNLPDAVLADFVQAFAGHD